MTENPMAVIECTVTPTHFCYFVPGLLIFCFTKEKCFYQLDLTSDPHTLHQWDVDNNSKNCENQKLEKYCIPNTREWVLSPEQFVAAVVCNMSISVVTCMNIYI